MNELRSRLLLFYLLPFLCLADASCNRDVSFDNPFDPSVSVSPPANLRIASMTDSTVTLAWNGAYRTVGSAQEAASAMIVEESLDGKSFYILDSLNVDDTAGTIKKHFVPNMTYYFRIFARLGTKVTSISNVASTTLSFLAPSKLAALIVTETDRKLSWQDNGNLAAAVRVERALGAGGEFVVIGQVPASTTAFTDTAVITTDTTYIYRICAISGSGSLSPYDTLQVYLDFPSPADLHMTCLSPTSVELGWRDSTSFESGYRILESVNNHTFQQLTLISKGSTSYTLTDLNGSNTYRFRISSYTPYNSSRFSSLSISCVASQYQLLYTRQVQRTGVSVYSMTFSPDGKVLACGGEYYVDLFRTGDGLHLAAIPHDYNFPVWDVKYSPSGTVLASAHGGAIYLWNTSTDLRISRLYKYATNNIYSLGFTPSGDTIAAKSDNGITQVWSLSDDSLIDLYNDGDLVDNCIAVSPDGRYFATGDALKLFSLSSGAAVRTFGSASGVTGVAFNPTGTMIASIGNDIVQLWSVSDGLLLNSFQEIPYARSVVFNAAGNLLGVAGRQDGKADVYYVQSGSLFLSLPMSNQCSSIAFSPLGNIIATGDSQGNVKVWGLRGTWQTN